MPVLHMPAKTPSTTTTVTAPAAPVVTPQQAAAAAALQASRSMWLTATPTGGAGTGTQSDPVDVSTAAKFDAFWSAQQSAHWSESSDSALFTLLPGTYYTTQGIGILPGWKINGSGQSTTLIHGTGVPAYSDSTNKSAAPLFLIGEAKGDATNCAVENVTLDGNTLGLSTPLTASFIMPPPRGYVTVPVGSTANLTVGKWVYVQDSAVVNGGRMFFGVMTVTAISGTQVTLQNAEVATPGSVIAQTTAGSPLVEVNSTNLDQGQPIGCANFANGATSVASITSGNEVTMSSNATQTGTVALNYGTCFTDDNFTGTVSSTACLFPYASQAGVEGLGGSNVVIDSVTVQDVSVPIYEGGAGIWLNATATGLASGDVINNCTVQDLYGIYGWCIMFSSNNWMYTTSQESQNDTYISGSVTNCKVLGNGYNQGIGLAGVTNTTFSGNTINTCRAAFYCDTGYNSNITITNNVFASYQPMHISADGYNSTGFFTNSTITNNTITIPTSYTGCLDIFGNVSNITISGNTMSSSGLTDHSSGIYLDLSAGMTGISATNNVIYSYLSNIATQANGSEKGNVDQNGNLVLVGLDNLN